MSNLTNINLINEQNFHTVEFSKLDWDVEVNGIPYQIVRAKGYAHCIGGRLDWGEGNDFWAYPLNESMTYENLIEFDGVPGATWGLEYTPTNYIKTKWDETEIRSGRKLLITRNGKPFCDEWMTFHQAIAYIKDGILDEHPLDLNSRDFDKKCIGRKVWWRSEPAVITDYVQGQACVILAPDGISQFTLPNEFKDDDIFSYDEPDIKVSIFDEHIYWFR